MLRRSSALYLKSRAKLFPPNLKRFAFERGGEAVEAVEEVESAVERLVATAEETEL